MENEDDLELVQRSILKIIPALNRKLHGISTAYSEEAIRVKLISLNERHLGFSVLAAGKKVFVKVFREANPNAYDAYKKEVQVLQWLGNTGLAPELIIVSETDRIVVTTFHEGRTVKQEVNPQSLLRITGLLANWTAAFANQMPRSKTKSSETWASYFDKYRFFEQSSVIRSARDVLAQIEVNYFSVAHNDFALTNFLVSDTVIGLDYEQAEKKPLGWDVLLACRALAKVNPQETIAVCEEFVNVFCAHAPMIKREELSYVAKVFVGASIFPENDLKLIHGTNKTRTAQDFFMRKLGLSTKPYISFPPSSKCSQLVPRQQEIHLFSERLLERIKNAEAQREQIEDHHNQALIPPTKELTAFCRVCQGKCCEDGLENDAFLSVSALRNIFNREAFASATSMHAEYIDLLPTESISGSCLYHTDKGCSLPRRLRSETCNKFVCGKAKDFLTAIKITNPAQTVLVSHHEDFESSRYELLESNATSNESEPKHA
jgi:thiamine kinase-like enzyme